MAGAVVAAGVAPKENGLGAGDSSAGLDSVDSGVGVVVWNDKGLVGGAEGVPNENPDGLSFADSAGLANENGLV